MGYLKTYFLPVVILLGFFTVITVMVLNPHMPVGSDQTQERVIIKQQNGQMLSYNIELAITPEQYRKGLMDREHLPENHGMLFLFQGDEERSFWMKNTLIPLDMIFIKADGTIHHIHSMAKPHDETMISSNGPVRAVLEVSGGEMSKYGVQPGDIVYSPVFSNMQMVPVQ